MKTDTWPFDDAPNTAVIADGKIIRGETWTYYVGHDEDDGSWQFHGPEGFASEEDAKVVSLGTMLKLDRSIADLADLPLGWCAWRDSQNEKWERAVQE